MKRDRRKRKPKAKAEERGITAVSVSGFKCIGRKQTIEIAPLTILAGSNSSGKSSMMQPLLLLKQTLQAPYDPGPLLLNGPDMSARSAAQLLSRIAGKRVDRFHVGVQDRSGTVTTYFVHVRGKGFALQAMTYPTDSKRFAEGMAPKQVRAGVAPIPKPLDELMKRMKGRARWTVVRKRCFLEPTLDMGQHAQFAMGMPPPGHHVREMIHIPALRGNPRGRVYPMIPVSGVPVGVFENTMASIIVQWQEAGDSKLEALNEDLQTLGLTSGVRASRISGSETEVDLLVGRRVRGNAARDVVSLADTGYGVSQVLPVLVALRLAEPGQLVYIEQPEIHLHPRAQTTLAEVVAEAAKRGVRLVAETHSALIVLATQTLVAEGKLDAKSVRLHWFRRDDTGLTEVVSSKPDKSGRYGDWPEDFGDAELLAHSRFLDAQR